MTKYYKENGVAFKQKINLAKIVKAFLEFRCLPHDLILLKLGKCNQIAGSLKYLKTQIVYSMNGIVISEQRMREHTCRDSNMILSAPLKMAISNS